MTHPVVPKVINVAKPTATSLSLEVVGAIFHTNQNPPILRIDIRNPSQDTSLEDCERMSRALETTLDATNLVPEPYVLEISSPGISKTLSTDRDFISFKGFPIKITTQEAFHGSQEWAGNLISRDHEAIYLNRKGRILKIPRHLVDQVQFSEGHEA